MANEFVIKNGFISRGNSNVFGGFTATTYGDITLGEDNIIKSYSGGGYVNLRYGSDNVVVLDTDNGSYEKTSLYLDNDTITLGEGSLSGAGITIQKDISGNVSSWDSVYIKDNTTYTMGTNDVGKFPVIISSQNALIPTGLTNVVIIGGQNITALSANTVYVPNINIGIVGSGTSVNNLGVDSDGNVVVGSATDLTGYVPYTGATTNVDLSQNNLTVGSGSTLFVDTVNNRVGVNTSSPSYDLHVKSGTANALNVGNVGNLPIVQIRNAGNIGIVLYGGANDSVIAGWTSLTFKKASSSVMAVPTGSNLMYLDFANNLVQIGTGTPTNKLDINGDLRVRTLSETTTATTYSNVVADTNGVLMIDNTSYVPYTGATTNVDLGSNSLTANTISATTYFGDGSNLTGIVATTTIRFISTSQTALSNDSTIICLSALTLTLPTAVGVDGKIYIVKARIAGITITMATTGGETIDDYNSSEITFNNPTSLTFQSDGTNWMII